MTARALYDDNTLIFMTDSAVLYKKIRTHPGNPGLESIGHPMEPHDFWNLAGRAGRWGDEFQGNIIRSSAG